MAAKESPTKAAPRRPEISPASPCSSTGEDGTWRSPFQNLFLRNQVPGEGKQIVKVCKTSLDLNGGECWMEGLPVIKSAETCNRGINRKDDDDYIMHYEEDCLVLERRTLRLALGCCVILLILTCVFILTIEPDAKLPVGILFGLSLTGIVITLLYDASPKRNLVITPTGLIFSKGIFNYQEVEIKWDELNEVKSKAIACRQSETKTNIILVSKKGETKPYQIKYSHLGGRHVKEHIALFTAKRAIGLIENLRDTKSQKERVEMIKASKGMTTRRYKHNLVTVPLHDRISLTCKVCESLSVYDKQKPKSEYRCPGCGSEEISEG